MEVWVLTIEECCEEQIKGVFTNKESAMAECKSQMMRLIESYGIANTSIEELASWSDANSFGFWTDSYAGILESHINKSFLCN